MLRNKINNAIIRKERADNAKIEKVNVYIRTRNAREFISRGETTRIHGICKYVDFT